VDTCNLNGEGEGKRNLPKKKREIASEFTGPISFMVEVAIILTGLPPHHISQLCSVGLHSIVFRVSLRQTSNQIKMNYRTNHTFNVHSHKMI